MIFRLIKHLKFLSKSTNQHGVHSPFVYDLVTKCFYDKEKKASYTSIKSLLKKSGGKKITNYKTAKLLNRLSSYFNYKKGLVLGNPSDVIIQILSIGNHIAMDTSIQNNTTYDLIYLDALQHQSDIASLSSVIHNDSVLIFNSIHRSEASATVWKKIKNDPAVKVTIDTFGLGFVFFRKEQATEHFMIRI